MRHFLDGRQGWATRAIDAAGRARDWGRVAYNKTLAWDLFKWSVLALLVANFILIAMLYGGISSELAELKRNGSREDLRAEVDKQIGEVEAKLMQAISAMQTSFQDEVANTSAKLDSLMQGAPASTAATRSQPPRPTVKPRR